MPPRPTLADHIADPVVARLFDELRRAVAGLHGEVRMEESPVDIRAEFRGRTICRVVPYRELLHVHVGESPTWETRLRTEVEYPSVVERVVRTFLHAFAHPRSRSGPPD